MFRKSVLALMEYRIEFSGALRTGPTLVLMLASVVTATVALSLPVGAQSRAPLFVADQETCFGRVYDRAHLARHPNQKVTSLHIFRYLGERPGAEWQVSQKRDEAITGFRKTGHAWVRAFVTFRGRTGYFHNWLGCRPVAELRAQLADTSAARTSKAVEPAVWLPGWDDGVHCSVECDGGSFVLKRESPTTVLLHNNGFVLVGCDEDEQEISFIPAKDDKVFRLESKPPAVCRAEELKAIPIRPGKPLRERFQESELFCFGRDYDAAHLAKHPQQKVVSIRVGGAPDQKWPKELKLSVALTLKAAATRRALTYVCSPREASWECHFDWADGVHSTCDHNTVHLARGEGDDILLFNRKDGLPIDAPCQAKQKSEPSDNYQQPTRSDDRTFRLARMPIEACR
jgi:hypothetical protein